MKIRKLIRNFIEWVKSLFISPYPSDHMCNMIIRDWRMKNGDF